MRDPWFMQENAREELEDPARLPDSMKTVDFSYDDRMDWRANRVYLARPKDVPHVLADPPGDERLRHYPPQSRFRIVRTEKPAAYLLPQFARRFNLRRAGDRYLTADLTDAASRRGDHVEIRGSFLRKYVRENSLVILVTVDSVRYSERHLGEFTLPATSESKAGAHFAYEIRYDTGPGPHERFHSKSHLLGTFVLPL